MNKEIKLYGYKNDKQRMYVVGALENNSDSYVCVRHKFAEQLVLSRIEFTIEDVISVNGNDLKIRI